MSAKPTKKETRKVFDKLLSHSANKTCIDCQTFNPQWASVNNGCFFCIKCAGIHRGMGVHITFVRSVTMDSWSILQLERMKNGGNSALKKFWKDQKFPKNLSAKEKYDNKAMEKYREYLLAKARKEEPNVIPFIGYERSTCYSSSLISNHSSMDSSSISTHNSSNYKMEGFGNNDYQPSDNQSNDAWNEAINNFGSWATGFASKTSAAAAELASKSKVAAISLSENASQKASILKNKITDEEFQANMKQNASKTWKNTTSTLSNWWSTASSAASNAYNDAVNNDVHLYNRDESSVQSNTMQGMSSDAYFNQVGTGNENVNNTYGSSSVKSKDLLSFDEQKDNISEKQKNNNNDWGFGGSDDFVDNVDGKKVKEEVPNLLTFSDENIVQSELKKKVESKVVKKETTVETNEDMDELDAFFNDLQLSDEDAGEQENENVVDDELLNGLMMGDDKKKKINVSNEPGGENSDENWGW